LVTKDGWKIQLLTDDVHSELLPIFPMVFRFSCGFPLVFLRFSAGFPMVFLGFPMVSQPPPGHLALGMPSTVIWDLVARDLSPEVSSAASPETTVDDVDG